LFFSQGTIHGTLAKLTLNEDFTEVTEAVVSIVAQYRAILGITFDPMDPNPDSPTVYCSSSFFFHGDSTSSSGDAINGKIHAVSGANLDQVEHVITGLPVSDHDHGINAIEFGNHGGEF
jgi:hypothetical protein